MNLALTEFLCILDIHYTLVVYVLAILRHFKPKKNHKKIFQQSAIV